MIQRKALYPFTAIVGQSTMVRALILNAVNPSLGGVLIRGQKGTAKSSAARGLAQVLPSITVVTHCPCNSHPEKPELMTSEVQGKIENGEHPATITRDTPFVELPLGATEDRVVGTLDIGEALKTGGMNFEPGLLAKVNRGVLYIDEVNLLDDHLVDVLLDAAAMGVNTIEREGISYSHPARFILIGSMNPEEGEPRPQLLDRFGLCVDVAGLHEKSERMEIVRRRLDYELDPVAFCQRWEPKEAELRSAIMTAQQNLHSVTCSDEMIDFVTSLTTELQVQGHRADIALVKTARTIAAWHNETEVSAEHIREAAELVLPHRMRRTPFEDPQIQQDRMEELFDKHQPEPPDQNPESSEQQNPETKEEQRPFDEPEEQQDGADAPSGNEQGNDTNGSSEKQFGTDSPYKVNPFTGTQKNVNGKSGRRDTVKSETASGRVTGYRLPFSQEKNPDLAVSATLRAAAPHQLHRNKINGNLSISPEDIRCKVRQRKVSRTIVFLVDSSGSMGAKKRMTAAKTAVLSLLMDAYQKRDRVGMIAFRGKSAEELLPPTRSVELARNRLEVLPTGGRTPMAHGLKLSLEVLTRSMKAEPGSTPLLLVISDGHSNESVTASADPITECYGIGRAITEAGIETILVDTESGFIRFGMMKKLAEEMGATHIPIEKIHADDLCNLLQTINP